MPLVSVSISRWSEKKFGCIRGQWNGFVLFNMMRPRENGRSNTGVSPNAGCNKNKSVELSLFFEIYLVLYLSNNILIYALIKLFSNTKDIAKRSRYISG